MNRGRVRVTLPSGSFIVPARSFKEEDDFLDTDHLKNLEKDCARTDSQRYLTGAERSTGQLRKKMLSLGYSATAAENTVEWAVKYGFVDDDRFCRLFIASRPMGSIRLRYELRSKGVSEEAVDSVLSSHLEENDFDETVIAVRKKYGSLADREAAFRRAAGWLSRRGYSSGFISRILKEAL